MTPNQAQLLGQRRRLLAWANELSDQTRNTNVSEMEELQSQVVDFLSQVGLGNYPICRKIETLNWCPSLPAGAGPGADGTPSLRQVLFSEYCYKNLEVLKRGLKFAGQYLHPLPDKSADYRSQNTPRPKRYTRRQRIRQTVEQLEEEFQDLARELLAREDYERVEKEHPRFLAFIIVRDHPSLKDKLFELKERSGFKELAREFAGTLHGVKPDTVRKACRKYKSKNALRKAK